MYLQSHIYLEALATYSYAPTYIATSLYYMWTHIHSSQPIAICTHPTYSYAPTYIAPNL